MAEHFAQPPNWEWYIAFYFYLAGLAGGCYTLATILRTRGTPDDLTIARTGYLLTFPLLVVCGILLTIDLGQPLRFWHMMIDTTPGEAGLNFKYWSPISLGTWALLLFSLVSFVSFLEAWRGGFRLPAWFLWIGTALALFLASYTGVVLSVSNEPLWSDSWAIGGLFVASALSASAALLAWKAASRGAVTTEPRMRLADGYFALLELLMIAIFFVTLASAGTLGRTLSGVWLVLWVLVLLSLVPPLLALRARPVAVDAGGHTAAGSAIGFTNVAVAVAVLVGVLLMRIVVIFSAQY